MVHTFCVDGRYLALDVDSGTVHLLDEMSYEVISRWKKETPEQIVGELSGRFDEEELKEVIEEVKVLIAGGTLFSYDASLHTVPSEEEMKPGVIKAMCLLVAHDCNLRCRYCFASTGTFHGQRLLMPLDIGKRALEFLIERSGSRKFLEVDFFGGEPMLNFGVVKQLVAYGRELEKKTGKTFRFTITTNAYDLKDEDIEFFNREMSNVVLSVDGRKEVHDFMRPTAQGGGSWDQAMANAKKVAAARNQQNYYVRGTFTNRSLDFSKDVLALADQGFEQISVEPVVLAPSSPYALLQEQLPGILEQYDILYKEYVKRRADGRWFSFFHFCVDLAGGPCIKKRLKGCGAGVEYVAVTADGEIFPCHQFVGRKGYCMGSVLDGTLDESIREKFAHAHVLNKEKCANCWARLYCTGGCAANADAFHDGDLTKPYDMECEMEKKRLECAIAVTAGEMEARGEAE